MSTIKVKVARAFCIKGKRQEVDKVIEIDTGLANELKASGKVTFDTQTSNQKKPSAVKTGAKKNDDNEADQLPNELA